jgi:hypothetical protein
LESILVVKFEELARDFDGVARRCAVFLGAAACETEFVLDRPKNATFSYNRAGELLRNAIGDAALKSVANIASRTIPDRLHPAIKRALHRNAPSLDDRDRNWLTQRFREDSIAFKELTGIEAGTSD